MIKSDRKITKNEYTRDILRCLEDVSYLLDSNVQDHAADVMKVRLSRYLFRDELPWDVLQIEDMLRERRFDDAKHAISQILNPKFPSEQACREHVGKEGHF